MLTIPGHNPAVVYIAHLAVVASGVAPMSSAHRSVVPVAVPVASVAVVVAGIEVALVAVMVADTEVASVAVLAQ